VDLILFLNRYIPAQFNINVSRQYEYSNKNENKEGENYIIEIRK